jgi:hypothetical protein
VAGRIACKDVSLFEAFSYPWTSSLTFYKLLEIERGLVQCEAVLGEAIRDKIARLKWSLWHGLVDKALGKIDDLESAIEPFSETYARFPRLVKALSELRTYIVNNRHVIPNYGERYHNGEAIATGFVESTVNEVVSRRFCKQQQMQWSKEGAHLLLGTLENKTSPLLWYTPGTSCLEESPWNSRTHSSRCASKQRNPSRAVPDGCVWPAPSKN